MTLNVHEGSKVVDTVTLRAVVLHNPQEEKPAECWPVVILTDDYEINARVLLNEYGGHWGQETAHRIGKHDLYLDILPPGYVLKTQRDDQGDLQWEIAFDQWAGTLLRKFSQRTGAADFAVGYRRRLALLVRSFVSDLAGDQRKEACLRRRKRLRGRIRGAKS